MRSSLQNSYICLLVVRGCLAIFGTGYIHPDEYFQNAEVTAGRIFGYHVLRTWEWSPNFAIRSILPPFVTTGLPFTLAKLFTNEIRPSLVFRLERLSFLGLSLLLDLAVSLLVDNPASRRYALLVLASTHVTHTFQVRPFSNSLEAVLVAWCFVALHGIMRERGPDKVKSSNMHLHYLAVLCIIGTFTRVTFLAFALPILWQCFCLGGSTWLTRARSFVLPSITASATSLAIIMLDSHDLRGNWSALVITPLNFLKYNLSHENLAEHGTHPRWLHLFVNLPMIVGPPLLWLAVRASISCWKVPLGKKGNANNVIDRTLIYAFFVAMTLLSLQPHQEPRFLLAFPFLFVVFVANSGELLRAGKTFWTSWAIFNIILTLLFGVLHQGGVVPSLFHVHDRLSSLDATQGAHVIYWKTYMPPWHLLGIPEREVSSGRIRLTDLAGAPATVLEVTFFDVALATSPGNVTSYLVAPFPMKAILSSTTVPCLSLEQRVFPHLDLDHIGESIEAGWVDGLSLGIWSIDMHCVSRSKHGNTLD